MTTALTIQKLSNALPSTLTPNTLYLLKVNGKVDIYVSDVLGAVAYKASGYVPLIQIKNQEGDYTLQAADSFETLIRISGSSNATVVIPYNIPAIPIGACVLISNNTTAVVNIAGAVGVTVNTPASLQITSRHGKITLMKVAENEWDVEGNLEPL